MNYQYETKSNTPPRTIYVLPRQPIVNQPQYTVIRPAYTLPPVAPRVQIVKHEPIRHAQPVKRRLEPVSDDVVAELLGETTEYTGPRKRERLTHLTSEEKLDRRKMRNRVAAQTARDRKKERSFKMEDFMKNLVAENRRLAEENEKLKEENRNLKFDIEQHYQSANFTSCDQVEGSMCVAGSKVNEPLESAAFISAPLLRVQARCMALQQATSANQLTLQKLLTLISLMRLAISNSAMNSSKLTKSSRISRALKLTSTSSVRLCRLSKKMSSLRRHPLPLRHQKCLHRVP